MNFSVPSFWAALRSFPPGRSGGLPGAPRAATPGRRGDVPWPGGLTAGGVPTPGESRAPPQTGAHQGSKLCAQAVAT